MATQIFFSGSLRAERIPVGLGKPQLRPPGFETTEQVREITDIWLSEYNVARPHSSLGALVPTEFAIRSQETRTSGAAKL